MGYSSWSIRFFETEVDGIGRELFRATNAPWLSKFIVSLTNLLDIATSDMVTDNVRLSEMGGFARGRFK
jgi:hypothetical protein